MMPIDENNGRLTANQTLSTKQIIIKNLIGGIFWGLGSVIGATIVVSVLVGILRFVNFVPIIGDFVSQIVQIVEQGKTGLPAAR